MNTINENTTTDEIEIIDFRETEIDEDGEIIDDDNISEDEESDFYVELFNNYIGYYKKKFAQEGGEKHMFTNINYSDKSSTNHMMEHFFELSKEYDYNEKENNDKNKIYNSSEFKKGDEMAYGIYMKDKLIKVSLCVFSLLMEITTNYNDVEKKDWSIIDL